MIYLFWKAPSGLNLTGDTHWLFLSRSKDHFRQIKLYYLTIFVKLMSILIRQIILIRFAPQLILTYSHLVSPQLKLLRESWLDSSSPASMSVLLKMTNYVLANTASKTNKAISLAQRPTPKSAPTPKAVLSAKQQLNKAHKKLKHSSMCPTA